MVLFSLLLTCAGTGVLAAYADISLQSKISVTNIDLLLVQARTRYPGLPIILYGHSLGGIQVLHYGLIRKPNIKGVIATSPGLHTELEKQQGKVLAAKVLGSLIPNTLLASGLDPKGISRDEKVVQTYIADPLVHDKISLGLARSCWA